MFDIIEFNFISLLENLRKSKDFDDVRKKHETWIKNLIGFFFMNYSPVNVPILTILSLVKRFLEIVQEAEKTSIMQNKQE